MWEGHERQAALASAEPPSLANDQIVDPRHAKFSEDLERAKGFEPSTPTLARLCSTTELHPLINPPVRGSKLDRGAAARCRRRALYGPVLFQMQQGNDDWCQEKLRSRQSPCKPPVPCRNRRSRYFQEAGQAAPDFTHALMSSPNSACVPGTGWRPAPGFQPQPTSSSCAMCSTISSMVLPPLRAGSLIC